MSTQNISGGACCWPDTVTDAQVLGLKVVMSDAQSAASACDLQGAISTGPIRLSCQEKAHSQPAMVLFQEMRKQMLQQDGAWRAVYKQA